MENHTLFVHNFTDWDPSNDVPSDTIVEFTAKHITEVWPFDPATGRFRQLGPEAPQAELKHHYIVKKDDIPLSSLLSEKIEQQRGSAELSSRPINLKKVDPECLRIIFASLSREDDRAPMPASVDLDQLVELVNTSNKCKTTKAIRKHLDACAQKFRDDENFLLPGNEKFIWVAYQLGYHSEFHALAKYWQMNASIDDNGEFLLPGGGRLSWDFEWIPHRLLGKLATLAAVSRNALTVIQTIFFKPAMNVSKTSWITYMQRSRTFNSTTNVYSQEVVLETKSAASARWPQWNPLL